ncbi:MAG: hypothetical protein OXI36_05800 [Gammaproteobacteria bacterium]|nr:hypothetical protein [Gammaproteobacteria bacterium]
MSLRCETDNCKVAFATTVDHYLRVHTTVLENLNRSSQSCVLKNNLTI